MPPIVLLVFRDAFCSHLLVAGENAHQSFKYQVSLYTFPIEPKPINTSRSVAHAQALTRGCKGVSPKHVHVSSIGLYIHSSLCSSPSWSRPPKTYPFPSKAKAVAEAKPTGIGAHGTIVKSSFEGDVQLPKVRHMSNMYSNFFNEL